MSVINTNISSMQAQNSVRTSGLNLSTAMERLSSGVRINSAKDDAAGLAISTRMTASIRGISAAIRNANDGISLTQTAEGSLGQISDNLQRIRELAVQSANTGNNASDRAAMNNEATQLIAEIDRVAANTTYNGINLLDGTFQDQNLQVGAGNGSNDRIAISISSAKSSALGVGSNSSYYTEVEGAATTAALAAGGLSINAVAVGASVADGVSYAGDDASGIAIAAAINAVSGTSGVTATVGETTLAAGTMTTAGFATVLDAGDVLINGVDIGGVAVAESFAERGSQMAAAINAVSDQTGVTATFSTDDGGVTLTAADGRNITVTFADSTVLEDTTGIAGTAGTGDVDDGDDAAGVLTTYSSVTLTSSSSDGITIGDIDGSSIAAAGLGSVDGYTESTATAGAGVSSIDLSTASGSQDALTTLDSAINTITDSRAAMGAYQNRLTASIANLETTSMNLSASRSRILDTDYAKETTNLAKSQIIQQAATAMLAQANQSGQSVLALLK
jgi:flagellin